ncbi:hypothetical protein [Deinococcus sp.]|uniref:hypothetical protein n=1 Tax=Deinococcus sp. TaxID=47478 RepID=UPI003B5A9E99
MLFIGLEDGRFTCQAYRRDVDGQAEELAVNFEGRDVVEEIRLKLREVADSLADA